MTAPSVGGEPRSWPIGYPPKAGEAPAKAGRDEVVLVPCEGRQWFRRGTTDGLFRAESASLHALPWQRGAAHRLFARMRKAAYEALQDLGRAQTEMRPTR